MSKPAENLQSWHSPAEGNRVTLKQTPPWDNLRDASGRTQLDYAVDDRNLILAKHLLDSGANPNIPDNHGNPAHFRAAAGGDVDMFQLLIQFHINLGHINHKRESLWHCAARSGNPNMVARVESSRNAPHNSDPIRSPRAVNLTNQDPIRAALRTEHKVEKTKAVIKKLIEAGAEVDSQVLRELDPPGSNLTPLYEAAGQGDRDAVDILLDVGAEPCLCIEQGDPCLLFYAIESNDPELVKGVATRYPDMLTDLNESGWRPLEKCIAHDGSKDPHPQMRKNYKEILSFLQKATYEAETHPPASSGLAST